jgi:hypothetical protein
MKFLFKLLFFSLLIGGCYALWHFWQELTPGERYHIVDKAKTGDVDGFADSVKYKADIAIEREKQKAAEALKEVANAAVDSAATGTKKAIEKKVDGERAVADTVE